MPGTRSRSRTSKDKQNNDKKDLKQRMKRKISKGDVSSPFTPDRTILGELPCEQRKIVKVRRFQKGEKACTPSKIIGKKFDEPKATKCKSELIQEMAEHVQEQKETGFHFEKDESALESILNETGIQEETQNQAASQNCEKHTMASSTQRNPSTLLLNHQRNSIYCAPKNVRESFKLACDEYLKRFSTIDYKAKRQRPEETPSAGKKFYTGFPSRAYSPFNRTTIRDRNSIYQISLKTPGITNPTTPTQTPIANSMASRCQLSVGKTPERVRIVTQPSTSVQKLKKSLRWADIIESPELAAPMSSTDRKKEAQIKESWSAQKVAVRSLHHAMQEDIPLEERNISHQNDHLHQQIIHHPSLTISPPQPIIQVAHSQNQSNLRQVASNQSIVSGTQTYVSSTQDQPYTLDNQSTLHSLSQSDISETTNTVVSLSESGVTATRIMSLANPVMQLGAEPASLRHPTSSSIHHHQANGSSLLSQIEYLTPEQLFWFQEKIKERLQVQQNLNRNAEYISVTGNCLKQGDFGNSYASYTEITRGNLHTHADYFNGNVKVDTEKIENVTSAAALSSVENRISISVPKAHSEGNKNQIQKPFVEFPHFSEELSSKDNNAVKDDHLSQCVKVEKVEKLTLSETIRQHKASEQEFQALSRPSSSRSEKGQPEITQNILRSNSLSRLNAGIGNIEEKGDLYAPTPVRKHVAPEPSDVQKVSAPIWTPLAMKSVARQQQSELKSSEVKDKVQSQSSEIRFTAEAMKEKHVHQKIEKSGHVQEADIASGTATKTYSTMMTDFENIADLSRKVELLTYSQSACQNVHETPVKKNDKKFPTAFTSVNTSLTPSIGSLSLRGNMAEVPVTMVTHLQSKTTQHRGQWTLCEQSGDSTLRSVSRTSVASLHSSTLRAAHIRYQEALLDHEVALYVCHLGNTDEAQFEKDRSPIDPVAKTLEEGDEMHFVPIIANEMNSLSCFNGPEGSAFGTYIAK
ncbi:hypothetical protein CHS0354_043071 [Potamilus streckersoni]|uniref:Uncharacterized protein n=1 Tax=Potamilus streckersoni TaxID=2493646 RepID=A0AAE0SCN6_9BIVA|nr:hypothetical protein CHS0354_043071 [Potamilus streckersoni]